MTFELLRINKNNICTFGVMFDDSGLPFIVTLELPDLNNQENISCIQEGLFTAQRYLSPEHGYEVFRLINVPGRTYAELHIGNFPKDSKGCILLGLEFGDYSIGSSKLAFDKFMNKLAGVNQFTLKISTI